MVRRIAALALIAGLAAAIAGCNTVAGVGKDMKAGGQAIESAADKAKPK
jgi:entericidin B